MSGNLTCGDAANLRWILGAIEKVPLGDAAYGLVTAGESLHWMDWVVVLPRFAEVLTANGVLAIAGRSWDGPPVLWERGDDRSVRTNPARAVHVTVATG